MIKITKPGTPPEPKKSKFTKYRLQCLLCNCEFECNNTDLSRGLFDDTSHVDCPCCHKSLSLYYTANVIEKVAL